MLEGVQEDHLPADESPPGRQLFAQVEQHVPQLVDRRRQRRQLDGWRSHRLTWLRFALAPCRAPARSFSTRTRGHIELLADQDAVARIREAAKAAVAAGQLTTVNEMAVLRQQRRERAPF
ncbi:MAG: hypothetical protein ABI807_11315 [Sporichthyaceae bacterium]